MGQITIYAELNRNQYSRVVNGEYDLVVPTGVKMENKAGSRGLTFYCPDNESAALMEEALYSDEINYNIIDNDEDL